MRSGHFWTLLPGLRRPARRAATAAALLVSLLAAACQQNPLASNYAQHGIGSQLPAGDIEKATTLQNRYFQHLCIQAGLPQPCVLPASSEQAWTLIVRQGMNDIDRRCDAYLEWLDDKKRSKGPLLSQLRDVQSTTTTILAIVDPASAGSLQIVAEAFNLINRSIENYHSRLLDQIESSTINAVVLRARHDFRKATQKNRYSTRPDAEYVLRSYLRLCLPFSIETNINDYSTLGSLGIAPDGENTINQIPVVGATLRADTPDDSFKPLKPSKPGGGQDNGAGNGGIEDQTGFEGAIEQRYSKRGVQDLQNRLCVAQTGKFDQATRAAIGIVEIAIGSGKADGIINTGTEEDVIKAAREGCSGLPTGAANTYEKFHFAADDNGTAADKIKRFQVGLRNCVNIVEQANQRPFEGKPVDAAFESGLLDENLRSSVKYLAVDLVANNKEQAVSSGLLSAEVVQATQNCSFSLRN